jgi:hypothetical protein
MTVAHTHTLPRQPPIDHHQHEGASCQPRACLLLLLILLLILILSSPELSMHAARE